MTAEIIAVGTELLLGNILNTNAKFLSEQLALLGINVHFQSVVGDNAQRLKSVVELAKKRSDIIILSGGLGPTQDDMTKQTVCEVFNDELEIDEEEHEKLKNFFCVMGRHMTQNNVRQAMLPIRGQKIVNNNGTAPGVIFVDDNKYAILLPGPPKELHPMFLNNVKPFLEKLSNNVLHSIMLNVIGIGESHLETMVEHLLQAENPTSALYAKTGEVSIRITAKAKTQIEASEMCNKTAEEFKSILGDYIYAQNASSLESAVVKLLIKEGKSVSTAESCTGGLVAQMITSIENSSKIFGYGITAYANEAKVQLLGVKQNTLNKYGAVSANTAAEMAIGVRELSNSDFGIGITGIAGPGGGTLDKPVGTVFVAVSDKQNVYIQKIEMQNRARDFVRVHSANRALDTLRRLVLCLPTPLCEKFAIGTEINYK